MSCTVIKIDRPAAVHLGVHYVKRNRGPDSWKAIVLTGSVGAYLTSSDSTDLTYSILAASWVGMSKAPQYSASKHGVLGMMRAIDKMVTADNIRIATIHPWFAGTVPVTLSPHAELN